MSMGMKEPEHVSSEMHIMLYNAYRDSLEIISDSMELFWYLSVLEDLLGHRPRELSEKIQNISKHAQSLYAITSLYDDPPEGYLPSLYECTEGEWYNGQN